MKLFLLTRPLCFHSHTFHEAFVLTAVTQLSRYVQMLREHFYKLKSEVLLQYFPYNKMLIYKFEVITAR